MQAAMFGRGESVDPNAAAAFAERATRWFTEHSA
jgi:hypothetical protein